MPESAKLNSPCPDVPPELAHHPKYRIPRERIEGDATIPQALPTVGPPRSRKSLTVTLAALLLMFGLIGTCLGGVLKVKTKNGIMVLENLPADAEVLVDGENVTVTGAGGGDKAEVRVRPGTRKIEVKRNGVTVLGEEVEIEDGKHRVLTVWIIPKSPPAQESPSQKAPASVEQSRKRIDSVLEQIGTPPIGAMQETALRSDALPSFSSEVMKKYEDDKRSANSPLAKAVTKARATLYALHFDPEPKDLSNEVRERRNKIQVQLDVLKEGYRAPGGGNAEKQLWDRIEIDERKAALMIVTINDLLEQLQSHLVADARENAGKRWRANYDFMLARVLLEHAFLFEYQTMLGSMRMKFPPRDAALHGGWKLSSRPTLQGDGTGKKSSKAAHKILDKIIQENAGSPWEVLAKRAKLANVGLEWQPTR